MNGTSALSGDVTTNSILTIDNTAATLQLKSKNVPKGVFQLVGNNIRIGTNFGNTSGNLVIRMNGNDRVQINPDGDINLKGKITRTSVTGNAPLLPVCMGRVGTAGNIMSGTGNFIVTHTAGTDLYVINCSQFYVASIIMVTPNTTATAEAGYDSPGKIYGYGENGNGLGFYFVVYNLN